MSVTCLSSPSGVHCLCMMATVQHLVMNHRDLACCWCGQDECENPVLVKVPGHGPYRMVLAP